MINPISVKTERELFNYLTKKRDQGYTSVEIIDNKRAAGWIPLEPTIDFVLNDMEPKIVGIDVRKER
jgi:hypothetical protein